MEFNSISSVKKKKKSITLLITIHSFSYIQIWKKKKRNTVNTVFSATGHTQDYSVDVVNHQREKQAEILDLSLWGSIIHRRRLAKKKSCKREDGTEKKNEPHNVLLMSSSLLWKTQIWAVMHSGLSRGSLYAHLHWFGSSIHGTGTLFIHTLLSETSRHSYICNGTWELEENATHPFVWAPAYTCHLPGLVIIMPMLTRPLAQQGWGELYVWVGGGRWGTSSEPPFVKLVNSRRSQCRQPGPLCRGAGPVSCCAFMQLWPFWHKCALTSGAAPS